MLNPDSAVNVMTYIERDVSLENPGSIYIAEVTICSYSLWL
jgi:hypothetical protein